MLKNPLNIYIVWHPNYVRGIDYANYLYSELCRDLKNPLSRGTGIPVFFRWQAYVNNLPIAIDFSLAERNAVIVLVDNEMFADDNFSSYFKSIIANDASNKRLFPIALSKYAYDVAVEVKEQFIRLNTITDPDETIEFALRCNKLKSELLHDLSRLLLDMKASNDALPDNNHQPVKLFISHAKKDGETIAINFRNYIRTATKLNSFFDANDIANGFDFETEIANGVKNSVLVVFQTDAYASREWCRIEVITAKRYKSPIVIVNAINQGEKRSFPYSGNAPSIRWNNNFDEIIDLALLQMLYNLYNDQVLKIYREIYTTGNEIQVEYLTMPPELFNYLDIVKLKKESKKPIMVLYPDPPLGNEELKLLNELDDDITFTTPIMLPKYKFK
jgi:hypothetical protein